MEELLKDKEEGCVDIGHCEEALSLGVARYSGGLVQSRLDCNTLIIAKIDNEIARRKTKKVKL